MNKSIAGILGMAILVGMGERMSERFLPVYIGTLGGGALAIGLLGGMTNLLGALYSFPGGYLADRYGPKRALLIFNLLAIFGFAIAFAAPSWHAVLAGGAFFLAWSAISLPATMGIVNRALPKNKHILGVSLHSLVRRFPMALGPLAGGWCLDHFGVVRGIRIAFAAAIVLAIIAAILQQRFIEIEHKKPGDAPQAEKNPFRLYQEMPPALRRLLVSDILVRFCEQIPYAFVVLWCTSAALNPTRVTNTQFGVLTAIEMTTAILIYLPVAWLADRSEKKPFVVITFCFFTAFPLALLYCQTFPMLVLAFILRGLKEFGEPTRKALILALSPENRKEAMFGLYYLIRDVVVSAAALGGAWLWAISPRTNLLAAFAFGVLGTAWFAIFGSSPSLEKATPAPAPRP